MIRASRVFGCSTESTPHQVASRQPSVTAHRSPVQPSAPHAPPRKRAPRLRAALGDLCQEVVRLPLTFKGKSEKKGPKAFARCDKLISVDCVTQPAANPDGLFSAKVDSTRNGMADPNSDPNAAPAGETMPAWAQQFLDRLEGIDQRLQAQEQFNQDVVRSLNEPSLEELAEMTDEELADLGLTRGEVDSAVAEATGGDNPGGGAEPAGAEADANAMSAGNRALREIHEFKAQMAVKARSDENASIAHAFTVVEEKVVALAALNDELTAELATKDAEITALRTTLKTGGKRVAPGMDYALFSAKDKNAPAGSFEQLVTAKFEELKTGGTTELSAKSKAIDFCVRNHTEAYVEYRERGGKLKL